MPFFFFFFEGLYFEEKRSCPSLWCSHSLFLEASHGANVVCLDVGAQLPQVAQPKLKDNAMYSAGQQKVLQKYSPA